MDGVEWCRGGVVDGVDGWKGGRVNGVDGVEGGGWGWRVVDGVDGEECLMGGGVERCMERMGWIGGLVDGV